MGNRGRKGMNAMIIYTQNKCIFCSKAKELLRRNHINYTEINISEKLHEAAKDYLKRRGYKTVPQIWDNDEHIGGYDELVTYLNPPKKESSTLDCDMNIEVMRDANFYKKPQ